MKRLAFLSHLSHPPIQSAGIFLFRTHSSFMLLLRLENISSSAVGKWRQKPNLHNRMGNLVCNAQNRPFPGGFCHVLMRGDNKTLFGRLRIFSQRHIQSFG